MPGLLEPPVKVEAASRSKAADLLRCCPEDEAERRDSILNRKRDSDSLELS